MSQGWTGPVRTETSLTVWQQLREAAVPVVLYWVATLYGLFVFSVVVVGTQDSWGLDDTLILSMFWIVTGVGLAVGQVLAFLRVRTWLLLVGGGILWTIFFVFVAESSMAGLPEWFNGFLFAVLFLTPIAATAGLWSLETNRALWSTWMPLLYTVGSVIAWSESQGTDSEWFAGDKWAIWDVVSFGILTLELVVLLFYLLTRETHRLALWKRGPMAPLQASLRETGASRPRLSVGGLAVILVLGAVLSLATALVAPYLWRTGPGDHDGGTPEDQFDDPQPPPEDNEFMKRLSEVVQKVAQAAQDAGGVICGGMTAFFLLGLLFAATWRPLKRLLVVRHLKDPLWQVSSTTRVEQGWRLVEIAMGDVGVHPRPGEDAAGLAARAAPVLRDLSPVEVHGLEDAAIVADRVRFGLGVGPADVATMERFSRWALDTVWERLGDWGQIKSLYRGL